MGLCLSRCVPLFIYGLFCRPLSGTTSLPEWSSVCSVTHPCSLRNFLNATVIRHFPSRVMECLLRCTPLFTYGNIQRLNNRHLRLDELFSERRCLALLLFRSCGVQKICGKGL